MDVTDQRLHVRIAHVDADDDVAVRIVATDAHGRLPQAYVGHLPQGHLTAPGQRYEQVGHAADVGACVLPKADGERVALVSLVDGARARAGEGRLDDAVEVADVEAVLGHFVRPIINDDLGHARRLLDRYRAHPVQPTDDALGGPGPVEQHLQVLAVYLDGNVGLHPGHQLVEAQLDGLGKLQAHAGEDRYRLGDGREHALPAVGRGPLVAGGHHQGGVAYLDGHGVGRNFGRAHVGDDIAYLGDVGQQLLLDAAGNVHALRQRSAGRQDLLHGQVALLQGGDELAAHTAEDPETDGKERRGGHHYGHLEA